VVVRFQREVMGTAPPRGGARDERGMRGEMIVEGSERGRFSVGGKTVLERGGWTFFNKGIQKEGKPQNVRSSESREGRGGGRFSFSKKAGDMVCLQRWGGAGGGGMGGLKNFWTNKGGSEKGI